MPLVLYDDTSTKDIVRGGHLHRVSVLIRVAQCAFVEQIMMRAATNVDRVMIPRDEFTINEHVEARTFPARLKSINHEIGMVIPGFGI